MINFEQFFFFAHTLFETRKKYIIFLKEKIYNARIKLNVQISIFR